MAFDRRITRNILLFIGAVAALAYVLYFRSAEDAAPLPVVHARGGIYAGDTQCLQCHQQVKHSFDATAHAKTSAISDIQNVKGSFEPGNNEFHFNESDKVVMEKTDSGLYQVGFMKERRMGAQRFDITVGSGTKGQTFLSWHDTRLVQLPASYSVMEQQWSSGPGNATDRFVVNRPIPEGCLNCHATHAEVLPNLGGPPGFARESIIYGVTCERCHGPAADHVALRRDGKADQPGFSVKGLNRRQKTDLCAQCHSGTRKSQRSFFFLPGDSLFRNAMTGAVVDTSAGSEVHGNQFDLLSASKCFLRSDDLTCTSCHDPHVKERGNHELFSTRCQSCHKEDHGGKRFCSFKGMTADELKKNCIDCHMPVRGSKKIAFRTEGSKTLSAEIARSHFISIYPGETDKIVEMLKTRAAQK